MARRFWLFTGLLVAFLQSSISLLFTGCAWRSESLSFSTTRRALDPEGLASFSSFSVLAGSPIPLALGGLLRRAEIVEKNQPTQPTRPGKNQLAFPFFPFPPSPAPDAGSPATPEPRDLMWAFPSFAVFLEKVDETAPAQFPLWARWLCLLTFWPGVIWYLYYKLLVEDDLRVYRGLGIGGSLVIAPFALGLFAGVFGEFAFGSLEGGFFDNGFSTAFYSAFAWIYLNQWFLYQKVNQLMEEAGRPAPLDPFGLFIPGWNFVTGIRQIHFLAEYWAIQRGEELPRDAFAELFPFAKKPTLSLLELSTTPSLWFNWSVIFKSS
ncbi:Na(+)/H(+) antiporter NhaD [Durusdinium trenchii]